MKTQKFYKLVSVVLAVMLIMLSICPTLSVSASTTPIYVVAGVEALCGVNWIGNSSAFENIMELENDIYTKTFFDVQPAEYLQFKVVENLADGT